MNLKKPSLTREFDQYVPFKVSLTLSIVVFFVSTALLFLFMYLYHRFHITDRLKELVGKFNAELEVRPQPPPEFLTDATDKASSSSSNPPVSLAKHTRQYDTSSM